MPLPSALTFPCRQAVRAALAALIAIGVTACAQEPPPERYTGDIEAQAEQERLSLKDIWDRSTTVHRAEPPVRAAHKAPPPAHRPAPAEPRVVKPAGPPAAKAKPSPDLAISAPPAARPPPSPPIPLTESDLQLDTTRCGTGVDCLAVLRAMIADPNLSWMMRAPTPAEFANGTRLFAYRALRRTLDCGRLRFAEAELQWAMDTFSRDVEGMDAAHRARVAALAAEVRRELELEIKQRC
ncbi:MAG: hypothetical protein ACK4TL_02315 [Hyphomicrobiaceae bacterium]